MQVLFDPLVTPIKLQKGERLATCGSCHAYFGFVRKDPGVVCSNEMEFDVDCPVCGEPVHVE